MRDISKLVEDDEEKAKKPRTMDELMENILRADMEVMMKLRRDGRNRDFPDPVEPRWKN